MKELRTFVRPDGKNENRKTKGESRGKNTDNTGVLGARCHMRDNHEEGIAREQYNISHICDIHRNFLLGMHMAVLLIDSGLARCRGAAAKPPRWEK